MFRVDKNNCNRYPFKRIRYTSLIKIVINQTIQVYVGIGNFLSIFDLCVSIKKNNYSFIVLNLFYLILRSIIQPGSLLGCLHPLNKKWMRCYVISILHNEANVALCDTGEITKAKVLKNIPDRFKNIPAITFEVEVLCICPLNKLHHLMEVELILLIFRISY